VHGTKRTRWPAGAVLALLAGAVVSCGISCGTPSRRPFAASESVAVFSDAVWAQDEVGRWHLVSATWEFEPELTPADIRYQFREGRVLTPGYFAQVLKRLQRLKEVRDESD